MAEVPSPFNNGWNWTCNTSTSGPCGWMLRYWPGRFLPFSRAQERVDAAPQTVRLAGTLTWRLVSALCLGSVRGAGLRVSFRAQLRFATASGVNDIQDNHWGSSCQV